MTPMREAVTTEQETDMSNAEIVELYPSVQDQVSAEEWEMRVNLAACYRLVDLYDMSDMTRTHNIRAGAR